MSSRSFTSLPPSEFAPTGARASAWQPIGLAVHERRSREVSCISGRVLATVRVSRRRAVVTLQMGGDAARPYLAHAAAHRIAANLLEHAERVEGWLDASSMVVIRPRGARVVVSGADAAGAVAEFFGPAVAAAIGLHPVTVRLHTRQLALGTLSGAP